MGCLSKTCSAYNIQFKHSKPIFIDTLSFENYRVGSPWVAYRQFCQHFLAPLSLMAYRDVRLNQLLRIHIDGIPLDLAASLLPLRLWAKYSLLIHIFLHARFQKYYSNKIQIKNNQKMSLRGFLGFLDNIESTIRKLEWKPQGTEWVNYYKETNYSYEGIEHKKQLMLEFIDKIKPNIIWDIGANTGLFSRLASSSDRLVVSFDIDPAAVEINYQECKKKDPLMNILPLLLDITNPSPGLGWSNNERMSLAERGPADLIIAMALLHHLAITNNLPFAKIAEFFGTLCKWLIIEYIPKSDSQIKILLANREDIFINYSTTVFENDFNEYFEIIDRVCIKDSFRILYFMKRRIN